MENSKMLQRLAQKKTKPEKIVEEVIKNPKLLPEILKGISKEKANVKFGCAKILRVISEKNPKMLYPKWDFFVDLLDSENNIFKWNAIFILANLTPIDTKNKFDKIFDKYFGLINQEKMVTAANVVGSSPQIVKAKPKFKDKITKILLDIEKGKWETSECKNILLGKTILAFGEFFEQIEDKDKVIKFVEKRLKNTRNATKKKAEEFLRKFYN